MKYAKPPLTFDQQADLLLGRGLIAERDKLIRCLGEVNYYRLSAYWYTFRIPEDPQDRLRPNTTFDIVWERYAFDRQLRILTMDAVERVEIAMRTRLVNGFSLRHGPFGHTNRKNLSGMTRGTHNVFLRKINEQAERSREPFVKHYQQKYHSEKHLPLWMAAELMTLNTVLTFYRHVETSLKQEIAAHYGVSDKVMESWLLSLNEVHNLCAHHARLWNRTLGNTPMIPRRRKHPQWHEPIQTPASGIFPVLTVLRYMLDKIAPQSQWPKRFHELLGRFPQIPLHLMGFPKDWDKHAIWGADEKIKS